MHYYEAGNLHFHGVNQSESAEVRLKIWCNIAPACPRGCIWGTRCNIAPSILQTMTRAILHPYNIAHRGSPHHNRAILHLRSGETCNIASIQYRSPWIVQYCTCNTALVTHVILPGLHPQMQYCTHIMQYCTCNQTLNK